MARILYHYTNQLGYEGILNTKMILPSLRVNNPKDARFGDGQYLSDIVPHTLRPGQLSMYFLGIPWAGKRFSHHINIDVDGLTVIHGRKHVYVIKGSEALAIEDRLTGHGRN